MDHESIYHIIILSYYRLLWFIMDIYECFGDGRFKYICMKFMGYMVLMHIWRWLSVKTWTV